MLRPGREIITRYPESRQIPSMDLLLGPDNEDVKVLYERWQDGWPKKIGARGGVEIINAAMLLEAFNQNEKKFMRTYGKIRTKLYLEAARAVTI